LIAATGVPNAATFPDSEVTAVHHAPSDYPSGKEGDVLTVEFTVLDIPCLACRSTPGRAGALGSESRERGHGIQ
jgi:predicted 3-demethylubiquinone-9 3-methyltransferase (glyoxalase superfamily)